MRQFVVNPGNRKAMSFRHSVIPLWISIHATEEQLNTSVASSAEGPEKGSSARGASGPHPTNTIVGCSTASDFDKNHLRKNMDLAINQEMGLLSKNVTIDVQNVPKLPVLIYFTQLGSPNVLATIDEEKGGIGGDVQPDHQADGTSDAPVLFSKDIQRYCGCEILHQLIDGVSHSNPISYSVYQCFIATFIVINCCRISQPSKDRPIEKKT